MQSTFAAGSNCPCFERVSKIPEYRIYNSAKARCQISQSERYPDYAGRGILFVFRDFEQFRKELGPRPTPQHSLDRIDNDGHYAPGNVRWATRSEQARNRRKCSVLTQENQRLQNELKELRDKLSKIES